MVKLSKFLIESLNINEAFINLVGVDATTTNKKKQYIDEVWDVLQLSYAGIGGIKGSGFNSKEDMLTIPFWKLIRKDGKIVAVIMYKDKGGRKSVAGGTDGSTKGKDELLKTFKDELDRSYGEKSGALLNKFITTLGSKVDKYIFTIDEVRKQLPDDEITPFTEYSGNLHDSDKFLLSKIDKKYHKYMYLREIGGGLHLKMMIGTPNKTIL